MRPHFGISFTKVFLILKTIAVLKTTHRNSTWKTAHIFRSWESCSAGFTLPLLELHLIYFPVDHSYVSKGWKPRRLELRVQGR